MACPDGDRVGVVGPASTLPVLLALRDGRGFGDDADLATSVTRHCSVHGNASTDSGVAAASGYITN